MSSLSSKHLAWNMEEKCLASELLYTKTILLVLSNDFFKSPKSMLTSSKTVLISDSWNIKSWKKLILVKKVKNMLLLLSNHLPICK